MLGGMKKKHIVKLSSAERVRLKSLVRKGEAAAQAISRAQILLRSDEGWADEAISEAIGISAQTTYNTRKRYCAEGLEAVLQAHGGRIAGKVAKALDGEAEAHLVALACGQPPEGQGRWTLRLLAGQMVKLEHVDEVRTRQSGRH